MRTPEELLGIAEGVVRRARALGADAAEAFVKEFRSTSIACHGEFASPKESHGIGVGVRVAVGGRLGLAGGSGLDGINALLASALASARGVPAAAGGHAFAAASPALPPPRRLPDALLDPDPSRLENVAQTAMDAMLGHAATSFASFSVTSSHSRFAVANSEGIAAWDWAASEFLHLEARVSRGAADRTALDRAASQDPIDASLDVSTFARAAVERAASAFDATALDRRVDAVVLHPAAASQILGLLSHALSASLAGQGHSAYRGRVGEAVAHPLLTIHDDPRGRRVDHEGVPPERLLAIDGGVLRTLLYDSASAKAEGRPSNGRGTRPSGWLGGVGVRPYHLLVEGGDLSLDALVEGVDRAVLVMDPFDAVFTSNEVTGDFSLVAPYAFLVEGGKVRHALPPTTIGGNVHDIVRDLRGLSRERREFIAGTLPAIHAGGVSCAT